MGSLHLVCASLTEEPGSNFPRAYTNRVQQLFFQATVGRPTNGDWGRAWLYRQSFSISWISHSQWHPTVFVTTVDKERRARSASGTLEDCPAPLHLTKETRAEAASSPLRAIYEPVPACQGHFPPYPALLLQSWLPMLVLRDHGGDQILG